MLRGMNCREFGLEGGVVSSRRWDNLFNALRAPFRRPPGNLILNFKYEGASWLFKGCHGCKRCQAACGSSGIDDQGVRSRVGNAENNTYAQELVDCVKACRFKN
jgi:formate hydrogenlyase subunit 6/NADH:ubiquinone oxidoreductase subunit I